MNLQKKALLLSFFTVGYNVFEGIIAIGTGILAGSTALVGFGVDSFVESLSGSVMIWRFWKHGKMTKEEEEKIEKRAVTFVAYSLFVLSAYIAYEAIKKLYLQEAPDKSLIGILIAIASLIIMPILTYLKYKTGKAIKSRSLVADSKQTLGCVMLSVALLIGLGLNYLFGFWQADPLTALVISGFLVREGFKAYKEKELCEC